MKVMKLTSVVCGVCLGLLPLLKVEALAAGPGQKPVEIDLGQKIDWSPVKAGDAVGVTYESKGIGFTVLEGDGDSSEPIFDEIPGRSDLFGITDGVLTSQNNERRRIHIKFNQDAEAVALMFTSDVEGAVVRLTALNHFGQSIGSVLAPALEPGKLERIALQIAPIESLVVESVSPANARVFLRRAQVTYLGQGSCAAACGDHDPAQTCWCDIVCSNYRDCCFDYKTACEPHKDPREPDITDGGRDFASVSLSDHGSEIEVEVWFHGKVDPNHAFSFNVLGDQGVYSAKHELGKMKLYESPRRDGFNFEFRKDLRLDVWGRRMRFSLPRELVGYQFDYWLKSKRPEDRFPDIRFRKFTFTSEYR